MVDYGTFRVVESDAGFLVQEYVEGFPNGFRHGPFDPISDGWRDFWWPAKPMWVKELYPSYEDAVRRVIEIYHGRMENEAALARGEVDCLHAVESRAMKLMGFDGRLIPVADIADG